MKSRLSDVLLAIQSMALDASAWLPAVRSLADYLGAEHALFYSPSSAAAHMPGVALDLDPEILSDYALHWHQFDVWTGAATARGLTTSPEVFVGEALVPHREFLKSTVYNDCLRHNGVARLMSAAILPAEGPGHPVPMAGAFYRSARRAPFSARAQARYAALLPHLSLALRTYLRIAQLDAACSLWQWSAQQMSDALLLLGDQGRVLHMSEQAIALIAQSRGLSVVGGRLSARDPRARQRLGEALACASRGQTERVVIDFEPGSSAISLTMIPLPPELAAAGPLSRIACLVLVTAGGPAPADVAAQAKDRWGLTAAETRVLERLLSGRGPAEIADDLGVAVSTVRTHLKRLYAKTDTTAQRELVAAAVGVQTPPAH